MPAMNVPANGESDRMYSHKTLIILFIPISANAETSPEGKVEFLRQFYISLLYCAAIGGSIAQTAAVRCR